MTSRAKLSRSSRSSGKQKQRAGLPSAGRPLRRAALAQVKDDLSRFLRLAESEEILITRHGKPAGVLIGFESEDDWFDYWLDSIPSSCGEWQRRAKLSGAAAVCDSRICRRNGRSHSRLERPGLDAGRSAWSICRTRAAVY